MLVSEKHPMPADARRFAEELAEARLQRRGLRQTGRAVRQRRQRLPSWGAGIVGKRGEIRLLEVENVLFQLLEDGETAVVELERGFHVVRVVHREYEGPTPLDEKTQKQIKEKLTNEIAQTEMKGALSGSLYVEGHDRLHQGGELTVSCDAPAVSRDAPAERLDYVSRLSVLR